MQLFKKLKDFLYGAIRAPGKHIEPPPKRLFDKNNSEANYIINLTQNTQNTMAMFNYGVGGNEVKVDANEAIQDIQENKTLLVTKLTNDEPINPEIITGLKTVDDVFKYYQPSISVDHESLDGQPIKENFKFKNLGDFSPKNITNQSAYLKNLSLQQEQYNKIVRQLKANKILKAMLDDEQSKNAFVEALKAVANEIKSHK